MTPRLIRRAPGLPHAGILPCSTSRVRKLLPRVSRFAETFTPYEGEELAAPLHELSNLE
jgi:hypothetical protein